MKIHKHIWLLFFLSLCQILACKKFISIEPPIDKIVADKVFTSNEMATTAVRGLYASLASGGFASGGIASVTLLAGRSSDEFINYYTAEDSRKQFADNNLLATNTILQTGLWSDPYKLIYSCNTIIENLTASIAVDAPVKKQLIAEAKFVRAVSYFYLTNLFGEVPIILGTDYHVNAAAFQSTQAQVHAQIITDLEEARTVLGDNYPTVDRTRANKWAATAMLARVHLYTKDYIKAETYASEVIAHTAKYQLITDDLNKVFLKNSSEAILQLFVPATFARNTYEGFVFILTAAPGVTTDVVLSDNLYQAFEQGDLRQSKWIGTFTSGTSTWRYPFKYKVKTGATPLTEYSMMLRLAEQYLIRAEARVNQDGKIDLGIADLNYLRARARAVPTVLVPNPLPALPNGMSKTNALLAVERERRIELFSEWGHRWLDLKRTGRADAILSVNKGANWQSTDQFYPIPSSELLNDPNLKQNPGYN